MSGVAVEMLRAFIAFVILVRGASVVAADPSVRLSTISPDGKFAVTIPTRPMPADLQELHNTIIEVETGRVLAELPNDTIFQDDTYRVSGARWLPDSSVLFWYVVTFPREIDVFDIVRFAHGAVSSQTELSAPIVKRMLRRGMRPDQLTFLRMAPTMSLAGTALGARAAEFNAVDGLAEPAFPLHIDVEIVFSKHLPHDRYLALEGTMTVVIASNGNLTLSKIASHQEIFNAEDVDP